jgi:hypothetical protein
MSLPLIISHDPETGKWFYKDADGLSEDFDTAQDLFFELKKLGKVQDSCPTCQDE